MMQPVADAHDRTVRWRQLVDLLSRPHDDIDPALLEAALTMVQSGLSDVPKAVRAATVRSIAGRAAEPRLVAVFAADRLEVAAPLLAAAPLDEAGWATVLSAASREVAAFVASLRGSSLVETPPSTEPELPQPGGQASESPPSIGEMVVRIEKAKSRREAGVDQQAHEDRQAHEAAPAIRPSPAPGMFRWECDPSGQIAWVEGAPRGALIGRSLPGSEGAPRELVRAFTDRVPFDDAPLALPTPALEGDWRLSGIPAFSPTDGRFLGYRGIARREGSVPGGQAVASPASAPADTDALRETIHEIKTPLNAIIGFAEIIDGQYLGPAHRNYRQRAAEIVAQARMLLAAIEDLDFAARLQRGEGGRAPCELAEILPPIAEKFANQALARDVRLRIVTSLGLLRCAIEPALAGKLLERLIGAAVEAAPDGQQVEVDVRDAGRQLVVSVTRPLSTRHLSDEEVMDPAVQGDGETASRLGLGFTLRLVRGLARLAGGDLKLGPAEFQLLIPAARG